MQRQIDDARQEMKILARQQAKELLGNPDRETAIDEMYREMLDELADRIEKTKFSVYQPAIDNTDTAGWVFDGHGGAREAVVHKGTAKE